MTVEEIVRTWRDDKVDSETSRGLDDIPESPITSVAVLDCETAPTRLQPYAGTCDDSCGDTCPIPYGPCNHTCFSAAECCC